MGIATILITNKQTSKMEDFTAVPGIQYEKMLIEWLEKRIDELVKEKSKYSTEFFTRLFEGRIIQAGETINYIKSQRAKAHEENMAALNKSQQT